MIFHLAIVHSVVSYQYGGNTAEIFRVTFQLIVKTENV